jgi:type IV pilus assembly protein PilA
MLGQLIRQGDPMKKLHTHKGGFTLIELMIVVAIIGILAAIAIPNFLRFQLKAKSSEGKTNLAAIRTAEQSFYSEFGNYLSATASPPAMPGSRKVTFVPAGADNGTIPATPGFTTLGWAPEGNVYFQYSVGSDATGTGFTAVANANIDATGNIQQWGYIKYGALGAGGIPPKGLLCATAATMTTDQVAPCTAASGQSDF